MNTNNQEQLDMIRTSQNTSMQKYEIQNLWRMRWFFAIIVAIGFLTSIAIGVLAFLITKNPYTLAIIPTPTIFIRVAASYLLPIDKNRFRLAVLKARAKTHNF